MKAIPTISSYYFTEGKEYEVYNINEAKTLCSVKCDFGNEKKVLMGDDRSTHLLPLGEIPGSLSDHDYDKLQWEGAGHFKFTGVGA